MPYILLERGLPSFVLVAGIFSYLEPWLMQVGPVDCNYISTPILHRLFQITNMVSLNKTECPLYHSF